MDGYILLFSGKPENEPSASDVGILLDKNTRKGLMNWKPVTDRIIWVRLKNKVRNITFIQCYTPTEVTVYKQEQLTAAMKDIPRTDIVS